MCEWLVRTSYVLDCVYVLGVVCVSGFSVVCVLCGAALWVAERVGVRVHVFTDACVRDCVRKCVYVCVLFFLNGLQNILSCVRMDSL